MTLTDVPIGCYYLGIGLIVCPFVIKTIIVYNIKDIAWKDNNEVFPLAAFSLVMGLISIPLWPAGVPLLITARFVEKEKRKLRLAQKLQDQKAA